MKELEYPFNGELILKKSKSLRRRLLEEETPRIAKRIAVLGGSTTHDIVRVLELFLLNYGITPVFYESEYGQYWQDAMFPGEALSSFRPDIVYVHTSNRNILNYPEMSDDEAAVRAKLDGEYRRFEEMWERLKADYACPVIQNSFEYPYSRLLGNRDMFDLHGRVWFINALNERLAAYARAHESFYINDINYLSACYGLDKWSDPLYWHMYKYALCVPAIPTLAYNIANIIKSVFGKNKKAMVLDLDNTLWGGVIGDDGADGIEIGQETGPGQVYAEFQQYLKRQKEIGIVLNVASKNDEENALAGLTHPDGVLKPADFLCIRANWEPKSENVRQIAEEMNILPESLVFVDDNPAERAIVSAQLPGIAAPAIDTPENYIRILDRAGYFETTALSQDDRKRGEMYRANLERRRQEARFTDYAAYLRSLEMRAVIRPFEPLYLPRIAQLTNKSNQFNLTTKRMTQDELAGISESDRYITLYGQLTDKFGDNGIVSLIVGRREEESLHIELWLMSCRVLKRDMEYAMMDALVARCTESGIGRLYGYYCPTAKNHTVEEFYALQGFEKVRTETDGKTVWKFDIPAHYVYKNKVIAVSDGKDAEKS